MPDAACSMPPRLPMSRRRAVSGIAGLMLLPGGAAHAIDKPTGAVVLSIVGRVSQPNSGEAFDFDMAMLERMPQHSFVTSTPWYATPRKFTGPLLRDVLAAAGAQGRTVRAVALNDYRVDLPFDDALRYRVIVARLLDDKPMAVRDKGPLFIVYPFDTDRDLRNTIYYSRSAWQLRTLEVS